MAELTHWVRVARGLTPHNGELTRTHVVLAAAVTEPLLVRACYGLGDHQQARGRVLTSHDGRHVALTGRMTVMDLGTWLGYAPSRAASGRGPLSRVPRCAAEVVLSLAGYRPAPANVWGRGIALDQALSARYCNGQRSDATQPDGRLVARAAGLVIFHDGYMSSGGAQRRRGIVLGARFHVPPAGHRHLRLIRPRQGRTPRDPGPVVPRPGARHASGRASHRPPPRPYPPLRFCRPGAGSPRCGRPPPAAALRRPIHAMLARLLRPTAQPHRRALAAPTGSRLAPASTAQAGASCDLAQPAPRRTRGLPARATRALAPPAPRQTRGPPARPPAPAQAPALAPGTMIR